MRQQRGMRVWAYSMRRTCTIKHASWAKHAPCQPCTLSAMQDACAKVLNPCSNGVPFPVAYLHVYTCQQLFMRTSQTAGQYPAQLIGAEWLLLLALLLTRAFAPRPLPRPPATTSSLAAAAGWLVQPRGTYVPLTSMRALALYASRRGGANSWRPSPPAAKESSAAVTRSMRLRRGGGASHIV